MNTFRRIMQPSFAAPQFGRRYRASLALLVLALVVLLACGLVKAAKPRERSYGCDREPSGWVCSFQIETLLQGKHPACRCSVKHSSMHSMQARCVCK